MLIINQGSIWGGGDSGLCHFSMFDSENVSLFEKNGINDVIIWKIKEQSKIE